MKNEMKETHSNSLEKKKAKDGKSYRKNYKKDKKSVEKHNLEDVKQFIDLGLEEIGSKKAKRDYSEKKLDFKFKKGNLKIIPLGGIDEVGKNITVFEYEDEIILVDCGLEFPGDDMLGVDLVIPDVTYLIKNKDKIKGLIITHGHEDHIGAIPYILKQVNMPIYATKLTAKLIGHKLEEHHIKNSVKLTVINQASTIKLGKMEVEFIRSSHSIPDAVMLAIHTPVGTVVHTGDFKVDYTPIDRQCTGIKKRAGR